MAAKAESGTYVEWALQQTPGEWYDAVLGIEARLRAFVRSVLAEAQADWEKLIPGAIRAKLEESQPAVGAPAANDLLDRADLGQLIGIISARWTLFQGMLGDKPSFQVKTSEFREWRNFLAHGQLPSDDQKIEIAVVVRQVGRKIPVIAEATPSEAGSSVAGTRLLWVDDHPEWNLVERQIFRALSIRVVPVLSNDEAVRLANETPFDLVISDIDRGDSESGALLPTRLHAVGIPTPVIFFVGRVDPGRAAPDGATSIVDDSALLLRDALNQLSR